MNGKLFVVMGTPGSGKSTFISTHANINTDVIISRDVIRLSMVSENEEYFSKEEAVFKEFIHQINENLKSGKNVWADATHLNQTSRNKLLTAISIDPAEVDIIWIKTPMGQCLEQNENRKGTRSYVPRGVIRRMNCQLEEPEFEEGFNKIFIVEPNKPIIIKEEA